MKITLYKSKLCHLLLFLIVISCALLSACSNPLNSMLGSDTGGSLQGAVPYEIKWYLPNSAQPDMQLVNDEMSRITVEKINASLNVEFIDWGSYDQKMRVKMASAEPMDLIFTSNWSNDYITAANKGAYLEIDPEKLKALAPNVLESIPEKCWKSVYVKDKLYSFINTQIEGRTPGILGYKKYFDKYSIDITKIKKMEELTPFLEKVKAGEPGIIPIGIDGIDTGFNDIALTYGIEIFSRENPAAIYIDDDSIKVMNYFEAPETKSYLKLVHDWYTKGFIRRDAVTVKDHRADLKSGKIALMTTVINPDTMANQAELWGVKVSDMVGQSFMNTYMGNGGILSSLTAISKTSKDPDKSYRLYNLLYDKQDTKLFNMLNYGIENRHYTRRGDVVKQIPNSGYWISCGWENGSMFNSYRQSEEQPNWYPIGPDMNNNAKTSKLLGFCFNPEPVTIELMQCAAVVNEYYNALFTGSVDPDKNLPLFLNKLKKAGADRLIEEMQSQIDEWRQK